MAMIKQKIEDARVAELLTTGLWRMRLGQSIGVEKEHIAFFQMDCFAFVLLFIEHAEQEAACFQRTPFAGSLDQQGRVMAGVAVMERLILGVEHGVYKCEQQLT